MLISAQGLEAIYSNYEALVGNYVYNGVGCSPIRDALRNDFRRDGELKPSLAAGDTPDTVGLQRM